MSKFEVVPVFPRLAAAAICESFSIIFTVTIFINLRDRVWNDEAHSGFSVQIAALPIAGNKMKVLLSIIALSVNSNDKVLVFSQLTVRLLGF